MYTKHIVFDISAFINFKISYLKIYSDSFTPQLILFHSSFLNMISFKYDFMNAFKNIYIFYYK